MAVFLETTGRLTNLRSLEAAYKRLEEETRRSVRELEMRLERLGTSVDVVTGGGTGVSPYSSEWPSDEDDAFWDAGNGVVELRDGSGNEWGRIDLSNNRIETVVLGLLNLLESGGDQLVASDGDNLQVVS